MGLMTLEELIYLEKKASREIGWEIGIIEGIAESSTWIKDRGIRLGLIVGTVRTYFKMGKTAEEVLNEIGEQFSLPWREAEEYVRLYAPERKG